MANMTDVIFSLITVICVLEGSRRITGWILPILAAIFLAYPFVSHLNFMPDRLLTRPYDMGDIFGQLFLKTEGLYSVAIGASVTFIFLFILFGAFLARSGMGQLFNDLALAIAGHKRWPCKSRSYFQWFMGSINGSALSNVVSTGAFTIPLMKKLVITKILLARLRRVRLSAGRYCHQLWVPVHSLWQRLQACLIVRSPWQHYCLRYCIIWA